MLCLASWTRTVYATLLPSRLFVILFFVCDSHLFELLVSSAIGPHSAGVRSDCVYNFGIPRRQGNAIGRARRPRPVHIKALQRTERASPIDEYAQAHLLFQRTRRGEERRPVAQGLYIALRCVASSNECVFRRSSISSSSSYRPA